MSLKLTIFRGPAVALALFLLPGLGFAAEGLDGARALASAGDVRGAVRNLNRMLASDLELEQRVQARYLKGMMLLGEGDTAGAKAVFERMVDDYPTLPEPYNNLAAIHASAGEYEQARALLVKILDQYPEYVVALVNLGDLYAKMAADAYRQARTLEPEADRVGAKLSTLGQLFEPAS